MKDIDGNLKMCPLLVVALYMCIHRFKLYALFIKERKGNCPL
jgi:hypothetical protein